MPVLNVAYAQNRKIAAGVEFTASQMRKIKTQLEEIAGKPITDADIAAAVKVYNENRAALRALKDLIGEVTPDDVLGVIFSKFCMGK